MSSTPGPNVKQSTQRAPASASARFTPEQIVASIGDRFDQPPTPRGYHQAIALAVFVQAIMTTIYIVAMGCFLRLCFYDIPFGSMAPQNSHGLVLAGPMLGAAVLFYMIKPLFAEPASRTPPIVLDPQIHPLIYQYVHRLCDLVNAPRPSEVWVDGEANASARLRHGVFSIAGNDLILTIGLPLVGSLTLRQLTGVIAHELGHFNQKAGMRVPLLVYTLNNLASQIVYSRDTYDEKIYELSDGFGPVALACKAVRLCNWLNRGTLWLFMMIGNALTASVSRMMEFDADQYEAAIVGSKEFAVTSETLGLIALATEQAYGLIDVAHTEKRLPDDMPKLVQHQLAKLTSEQKLQMLSIIRETESQWYETHPSHTERVEAAAALKLPGTHKLEAPATVLFDKYRELCLATTKKFYKERIARTLRICKIVPTEAIMQESDTDSEAVKSVERYYQGSFAVHRPLFPSGDVTVPPEHTGVHIDRLREARGRMVNLAHQAWGLNGKYREAQNEGELAQLAREAIEAGVPLPPTVFGLVRSTVEDAERVMGDSQTRCQNLNEQFKPFDKAARERLELGLRLMFDESLTAKIPRAKLEADRAQIVQMLNVALAMEKQMPLANDIYRRVVGFMVFASAINSVNPHPGLMRLVMHHAEQILNQVMRLTDLLYRVEYPFEGAGTTNVGDYLVTIFPEANDYEGVIICAESAYKRFGLLLRRVASRLTHYAETSELAAGLIRVEDASAGEDPLASVYQEIESEKRKRAEIKENAELKKEVFFGPEARAAAAAMVMVSVLLWFYVLRRFVSPGDYHARGENGRIELANTDDTGERVAIDDRRSANPENRVNQPPPYTPNQPPYTQRPFQPNVQPPSPPPSMWPHTAGQSPNQQSPNQTYSPPAPRDSGYGNNSSNRSTADFAPDTRVIYAGPSGDADAVAIAKLPDGKWRVGYVENGVRKFASVDARTLSTFYNNGAAKPRFVVGDQVTLLGPNKSVVWVVASIMPTQRNGMFTYKISLVAGQGGGLVNESQMMLIEPPAPQN